MLVLVAAIVVALVVVFVVTSQDSDESSMTPTSMSPSAEPTTGAPDETSGGAAVEVLEQYAGAPEGAEAGDLGAVVMADEGTIHVFTTGSSTCPAVPTAVTVDGDDILVTVKADDAGPCTMDFVPTTSVIAIPDEFQGAGTPVVTVERAPM